MELRIERSHAHTLAEWKRQPACNAALRNWTPCALGFMHGTTGKMASSFVGCWDMAGEYHLIYNSSIN